MTRTTNGRVAGVTLLVYGADMPALRDSRPAMWPG